MIQVNVASSTLQTPDMQLRMPNKHKPGVERPGMLQAAAAELLF